MQTLKPKYTGKKARTGGICFDEQNRMQIFISYCTGCDGKVLLSVDEARYFSRKYCDEMNKKRTKLLFREIDKNKL